VRIHKYTLKVEGTEILQMPKGAQILSVQVQHGEPQLWALVDETAEIVGRLFSTYGTGQEFPHALDHGKFIGTYQLMHGSVVFHVFDNGEEL